MRNIIINLFLLMGIAISTLPGNIFIKYGIIDDFNADDTVLYVELDESIPPGPKREVFTKRTSNGILGEDEELGLVVTNGYEGSVISCGVINGSFNMAVGAGSEGYSLLTYDGKNNVSEGINPVGLGGISIISNGSNSFEIIAATDHPTRYNIKIWTDMDKMSEYTGKLPVNLNKPKGNYVKYSDFIGNANFDNVGAVQLIIFGDKNVDILIESFNFGKSKTLFISNNGGDTDYYDFHNQCVISIKEYCGKNSTINDDIDKSDSESLATSNGLYSFVSGYKLSSIVTFYSNTNCGVILNNEYWIALIIATLLVT